MFVIWLIVTDSFFVNTEFLYCIYTEIFHVKMENLYIFPKE
jgi:hypothetical protein